MPGIGARAGAVAFMLLTACRAPVVRADDDVLAAPEAAAQPGPGDEPPGIDLAAHVDINVVLPPNHWRVNGGLQNVVIGGGRRLVIDGNLTIGGEPVPEPVERVKRTDEQIMVRLRTAQRSLLAPLATDPRITARGRRSLELATEADIRRVMADVARTRGQYAGLRGNLGDETWQRFQKDVHRCRQSIAEPFGPGSLFAAVRAGIDLDAPPE